MSTRYLHIDDLVIDEEFEELLPVLTIYQITEISFFYMTLEAVETDMMVGNVAADEIWDIEEFKNYEIKLINNGGKAEIMDFSEWKRKNIG